jgi:very-short-patch-repair endonuclease
MRRRLKPGAVERARDLPRRATDADRILWARLRDLNARGYHFRRQAPFRAYTLDFVEHSHRLIVDGSQHGEQANVARDIVRDRIAHTEQYRVLRFWNVDVLNGIDLVVEPIQRASNEEPPINRTRVVRGGVWLKAQRRRDR